MHSVIDHYLLYACKTIYIFIGEIFEPELGFTKLLKCLYRGEGVYARWCKASEVNNFIYVYKYVSI